MNEDPTAVLLKCLNPACGWAGPKDQLLDGACCPACHAVEFEQIIIPET
jgi:hypothetical protein